MPRPRPAPAPPPPVTVVTAAELTSGEYTEEAVWARLRAALRPNIYMGPHLGTLSDAQVAFLVASRYELLFGGATKGGKALSLDTPLPTPTGWTTMGAVQVGDWLLDDQGQPCCVTVISPVMSDHDVFDVEFDDGNIIRADANHRWLTQTVAERAAITRHGEEFRAARRAKRPSRALGRRSARFTASLSARNATRVYTYLPPPTGTVRTTQQIRDSLTTHKRANHIVPLCAPLDLPEMILPLDPYVLGVWLGDGTSSAGSITSNDQEIVEAVAAAGIPIQKRSGPYHYGTTGLSPVLRKLHVLNNKHIPALYLRTSREQRWALLQGLMDTDGTVDTRGQCEIDITNPALAQGILELLHSLGIRTRMRPTPARLYGKECGTRYRLKFMSNGPVFRLTRKRDRHEAAPRLNHLSRQHRSIVAVRAVPSEPVKCVAVDSPSHLYLAGQAMIPTHNTDALLIAGLQYIDIPYYQALILDRSFTNLTRGDGIIPRIRDWTEYQVAERLRPRWDDENHASIFPSGAKITFGFIERPEDQGRYKRANYQFLGWEELTEHPPGEQGETSPPSYYTYLFSRMARPAGSPIPLRVRGTTNPDGPGRLWVKTRFGLGHDENGRHLPPPPPQRWFIPSTYRDNPGIDQEQVKASLSELDAVTRAQLEDGNWDVAASGDLFFPERIRVLPSVPESLVTFRCRAWDKAGTEDGGKYTVGLRLARLLPGQGYPEWVVEAIVRGQWSSERREAIISATMLRDPIGTRPDDYGLRPCLHVIEQEPGSGGKESAELTVKANPGIWIEVMRPTGDKITRVRPFSVAVNNYNVGLIRAPWNDNYLNELRAAPNGVYWDQLDTSGMAYNRMALAATPLLPASAPGQMRALPPGARF